VIAIDLPAGFAIIALPIGGEDVHDVGRRAAEAAIAIVAPGAKLAHDGMRPVVDGAAVSITHSRGTAVAVAARVEQLGIDLVDDADAARIAKLVDRYFADERALLDTPLACARCFAAKEAALKAFGLGLLDGGAFDRTWPVRVISLDPPRLDGDLTLVFGRTGAATLAVVYR
jgi:phosphopantetheinyl transferase (holo-ACP synthase)